MAMKISEVDQKTRDIVSALLDEKLNELPRKSEVIGVNTHVPIKITVAQAVSMFVFVCSIIGAIICGVWWLSEREHLFRSEIVGLRIEFKDEMVKLREDMNTLLQAMSDAKAKDIELLKKTVAEIQARTPLIQESYRHDMELLDKRLSTLERIN